MGVFRRREDNRAHLGDSFFFFATRKESEAERCRNLHRNGETGGGRTKRDGRIINRVLISRGKGGKSMRWKGPRKKYGGKVAAAKKREDDEKGFNGTCKFGEDRRMLL